MCVYREILLFWLPKNFSNFIKVFIKRHALNENAGAGGSHFWGVTCGLRGEVKNFNLPVWAFLPHLALNLRLTTSHFHGLAHELFVAAVNYGLELIIDTQEVVLKVSTSQHPQWWHLSHDQNDYTDTGRVQFIRQQTLLKFHQFSDALNLFVMPLCIILWHLTTHINSCYLHQIWDTEMFHHHKGTNDLFIKRC